MAIRNMFAEGLQIQQRAYESARESRQDRARIQAGRKIGAGNFTGAAQDFGGAGLTDDARQSVADQQTVDDRGTAERKRGAEVLLKAMEGLKTVPPGQRKAALSHPIFQHLGLGPDITDQITEDHLSDQNLNMAAVEVKKQFQAANLGNGGFGSFDPSAGTLNVIREPEYKQEYLAVPEGGKLVPVPRGGQPQAPAEPSAGGDPAEGIKALTGMGATITSGRRSADHNAEVGGVPNSRHLSGQAVDLVPPKGVTLAQLGEEARRRVPGAKVIVESDHVHVQWGGASQGGDPAGTVYGAPKGAEWVTLSPEEAKSYGPGQFQRNAKTGEVKQVGGSAPKGKLSATALNIQNDHIDALQTATAVNTRLTDIGGQLDKGDLRLGPVSNVFAQGRNLVGQSDQQSRNFSSFRGDLEKLRNDSLRLNKGVQTEGDAVRAWNELLENLNDGEVVRQRLAEIVGYNEQAAAYRKDAIAQIREDAGLPPIDGNKFVARSTLRGAAAVEAQRRKQPSQPAKPSAVPRPGTVVKGYRFNGGDPARPQSWTKVQ